ncbi:hypothetical protein D3C81_1096190 [compost metagenome]
MKPSPEEAPRSELVRLPVTLLTRFWLVVAAWVAPPLVSGVSSEASLATWASSALSRACLNGSLLASLPIMPSAVRLPRAFWLLADPPWLVMICSTSSLPLPVTTATT